MTARRTFLLLGVWFGAALAAAGAPGDAARGRAVF